MAPEVLQRFASAAVCSTTFAFRGGDKVACAACHDLATGGDDGRPKAVGYDGRPLDFNTPTVFNVALNFRLNWRGNFRTLEEQIEALLHDPRLMNTSWSELLPKLRADPGYRKDFIEVYGRGPGERQVVDALVAFERSLMTPNARFDRYLRGERDALTAAEEDGYQLFKDYGCTACHQGAGIGGNLFQRYGIFADPFADGRPPTTADLGRFSLTNRAEDRHVFRVPSLRNVAVTAPYFHDGSRQISGGRCRAHGAQPARPRAVARGNRADRRIPADTHRRA